MSQYNALRLCQMSRSFSLDKLIVLPLGENAFYRLDLPIDDTVQKALMLYGGRLSFQKEKT